MIVRSYKESDLGTILDLYRRQGLDYELPALDKAALSCVIEEGGNITHAVFLKHLYEAVWIHDKTKEWKRQTLGRFLVLHKEMEIAAARIGIDEVNCWVAPDVLDKRMDLTMMRMGWEHAPWPCYRHKIAPQMVEV